MQTIKIANKKIGRKQPTFIIAEAGVNHNGKLYLALKLVEAAAAAGADAVKFQTFQANQVVTKRAEMAEYQKKNINSTMSQRMLLDGLELEEKFYLPIIKRCQKLGILFMSTPHGGKASVDYLEHLGICAYKIGSGDLNNFILLKRVAKTGKPVILSTGMSTLKEVKSSIAFLRSKGNKQIAVLHCTTNYPCPVNEVNLLAMCTMMKELQIPVGYSDHTLGRETAIMAVTLGAAIYECHLTLNKDLPGPDHRASAEPQELKEKILAIRNIPLILGSPIKKPTQSEALSMRATIRRSLVATQDIPAGKIITEEDLEAKRPGDGISPAKLKQIIGRKMRYEKKQDDQITWKDLI